MLTSYSAVIKLCKNENTRRVHLTAYESRNRENIALLEEAVQLRRKFAKVRKRDLFDRKMYNAFFSVESSVTPRCLAMRRTPIMSSRSRWPSKSPKCKRYASGAANCLLFRQKKKRTWLNSCHSLVFSFWTSSRRACMTLASRSSRH